MRSLGDSCPGFGFEGLPPEIINRPGCEWTAEDCGTICTLIFIPPSRRPQSGLEDPAPSGRNYRRAVGFLARKVNEAPDILLEDAIEDCMELFLDEGAFLGLLEKTGTASGLRAPGSDFVDWFAAAYPACAALVPVKVVKPVEAALAAVERRQAQQPFEPKDGQSLEDWLDRLMRLPAAEDEPICRPSIWKNLIRTAVVMHTEIPFRDEAETFKQWYRRASVATAWQAIRKYEEAHPFDTGKTGIKDWFLGAIFSLPNPALLVKGYKSFDPARGNFNQWFFGVIAPQAKSRLLRKIKKEPEPLFEDDEDGSAEESDEELPKELPPRILEVHLRFAGEIGPPAITRRRADAFSRYAKVIAMRFLCRMSYEEIALEYGTEGNARQLKSRGLAAMFALFGIAVDVPKVIRYAAETLEECEQPWARATLERCAPVLLAVYAGDMKDADRFAQSRIGQLAAQFKPPVGDVFRAIREAWGALMVILDATGKSFYDFKC